VDAYVWLYRLAALVTLGLALLHVGMIFVGARAYRYFDAGEKMAEMAEKGSPVPAIITLFVAGVLAAFGVYALAGAGDLQALPFQSLALVIVLLIFLLRGAAVIIEAVRYFTSSYPLKSIGFSLASLAVGLIYASAFISLSSAGSGE
jgi:hypothetical protein